LTPHRIPMAESLIAINSGDNLWELKGVVYPEANSLDEISIEYGINNFNNSTSIDPSLHSTTSPFNISTNIDTDFGNTYQYRVKIISNGKTYFSNNLSFSTDQTICTPIINNNPWYKRIKNVTFDGDSNDSSGSTGYEDFTNLVHTVEEGNSYTFSITDSYAPGFNLNYVVYIDYNNDGDFNDYHETVAHSEANNETFTGSITIPTENIVYDTDVRMRVIGYNGEFNSCGIDTGDIEDYTVKITQKVLNVKEQNDLPSIKLYPNPVKTEVTIAFPSQGTQLYTAQIMDLKGNLVFHKEISTSRSEFKIEMSQLNAGVYILKLSSQDGKSTIKKIIKSE